MTNLLVRLFVKNNTQAARPDVRAAYGRMAGWVGIVCNLMLSLLKLVAGGLSGSIAIMADAVNNLSDASASVITLVGFKLAAKPADKEHPFGHARFEYIAGLAVSVLVLVIGIELGRSSLDKIMHPTPVSYTVLSFVVLLFSVLVKLWMAMFNRKIGRRIGSATLQATFADSRNDAITTSAVLLAAAIAYNTGYNLDGWMGLAVALFILYSGIGLICDTLSPLLGEAPDPNLVQYVGKKISGYSGVLGTHDLIVHDYGPGRQFASAHVEMSSEDNVLKSHDTIDNIERDFLEQDNIHLIIHYDPIVTGDAAINSARSLVEEKVRDIHPKLTIHDFRMVDGPSHTNYVFDVVLPAGFEVEPDRLVEQIEAAVQHGKKPIHTIVTLDSSYAPIQK